VGSGFGYFPQEESNRRFSAAWSAEKENKKRPFGLDPSTALRMTKEKSFIE